MTDGSIHKSMLVLLITPPVPISALETAKTTPVLPALLGTVVHAAHLRLRLVGQTDGLAHVDLLEHGRGHIPSHLEPDFTGPELDTLGSVLIGALLDVLEGGVLGLEGVGVVGTAAEGLPTFPRIQGFLLETDVADVHLEFLGLDGLRPVLEGQFGRVLLRQVAAPQRAVRPVPLDFLHHRAQLEQNRRAAFTGEELLELETVPLLRAVLLELFEYRMVLRGEGDTSSILRLKVRRSRICKSVRSSIRRWKLVL